ncbi:MAG: RluA family pseudouridine synthase [Gammaproteobacteria bacterium]|nr:RluA family pseudouridine synthase [Gammaproteobacteria bacterium]
MTNQDRDTTESSSGGVSLLNVSGDYAGQRIDNYLSARLKGVPKSRIYRLLRTGEIRVNKGRAKPDRRLEAGDVIRLPPIRVAESEVRRPPASLLKRLEDAIVYEDDQLMVIDKPAGIAVHSGTGIDFGVIEGLQVCRPDVPGLSLVHRLDRETSGCLLLCKDRRLLPELNRVLASGAFDKRYLALVCGEWDGGRRSVRAPLALKRAGDQERRNEVNLDEGKSSETVFLPRERLNGFTLLEARLHSGRMHQIRAHAAHIGHPLAGDDKYGDRVRNRALKRFGLKRLFLHAYHLSFAMPGSGKPIRVEIPLAEDLQSVLERMKAPGR